ncbi:MAG: potassium transporter TrkG [Anaerolineales bacterium]
MFFNAEKISRFTRRTPTPLRLALGLMIMIALGTLLFTLPGVTVSGRMPLNEAFFTATSALTVTGLSVITPGSDLTLFGQIILLALIQIGGVGFMVVAVLIFRLIGRSVSFADRLALRDSFGLLDLYAIVRLTRQVVIVVFALELTGALLLWLHWRPELGDGRALFYALFHAISAFCNAGFDLFSGTPGFAGIPNDNITLSIFGVLIFIGGLGIPVVADLGLWRKRRRISLHTRLTLIVSLLLLLLGWLGLFLAETGPSGTLANEPPARAVVLALFQSISARTAGFSAIYQFEELTPASQLLKIVLMFIGTAPASMGGGITTGTFTVLLLALWAYARGRKSPRVFGRSIGFFTVRRASAILTISIMVIVGATWLLLITHPHAVLDKVIFEVVSAFATCGLSLEYTSNFDVLGQTVIAFVMFWGRLGAMTIVLALAQLVPHSLIEYPEERILI